jgi:hypothetical protein
MKIFIEIEEGIITSVTASEPIEAEVYVIDHDCAEVPDDDDPHFEAYLERTKMLDELETPVELL